MNLAVAPAPLGPALRCPTQPRPPRAQKRAHPLVLHKTQAVACTVHPTASSPFPRCVPPCTPYPTSLLTLTLRHAVGPPPRTHLHTTTLHPPYMPGSTLMGMASL